MFKYCVITIYTILLCLIGSNYYVANAAHIVCFIDNTESLNSELHFFHNHLIPRLLSFSRAHGYTIEFYPIGDHKQLMSASSKEKILKMFTFDNPKVHLSESFKKNVLLCSNAYVNHRKKETIVIVISEFQPRHINDDSKISYDDYIDFQDSASVLQTWHNVHFIQLVNKSYQPVPEDSHKFYEKSFQENIQALKSDGKRYISKKDKIQLINGWLHELITEQTDDTNIHRYQVKKDHFMDMLPIAENIIDDTKIDKFYVTIVIDHNLFSGSKNHIDQFKTRLEKQISRKGPSILCNNPFRKIEKYRVSVGLNRQPTQSQNEADEPHYIYTIKQGTSKQYAHLILKNKNQKREYHKRPGHCRYQLFYQSGNDLITQILFALQQLRVYHKTDFKIKEKLRKLCIDIPNPNLLKGFRISKKDISCDEIKNTSSLSHKIDENGEFHLLVNMQGQTDLCLVAQPEVNEDNDVNNNHMNMEMYMTGWEIGMITEKMIMNKPVDTPICITNVQLPTSRIVFQYDPDICINDQNIPRFSLISEDYIIKDFPLCHNQTPNQTPIEALLPGNYRYHIEYPYADVEKQNCLNQLNKEFKVSRPESTIHLTCQPDYLTNYTVFFNDWESYDEQMKRDHILGSPNFFRSLLTFTSLNYTQKESIAYTIWSNAYDTLIDKEPLMEKKYKYDVGIVLKNAFVKLEAINEVDYAEKHFQNIMEKICGYPQTHIYGYEFSTYDESIRRIDSFIKKRDFIQFLRK